MKSNDLELLITEAEGWIGRLKALKTRHDVPPFPGADAGACPNHGNPYCLHCKWPSGKSLLARRIEDEIKFERFELGGALNQFAARTMSQAEFQQMYADRPEQSTGYTAVDMATAAAEGFRDGVASVVVQMPSLETLGEYSQEAGRWVLDACEEAIEAAGGTVIRP